MLGEGGFATVRLATLRTTGVAYAMKLVDKSLTSEADALHELHILEELGRHRHIVSLVDRFELDKEWAFVLELAGGGEVFERICEKGAYSEADAAVVVRHVALALAYMHSIGVVHRDLKPENLLYTSGDDVKVADFGLAAMCGGGHPPLHECCGTLTYMAPEILSNSPSQGVEARAYGAPVDNFALGAILFTLLSGYFVFNPSGGLSDEEIEVRVLAAEWSFGDYPERWASVSDGAKALVRALLQADPATRLSADALLQDEWVKGGSAPTAPLPGSDTQLQASTVNHAPLPIMGLASS